MANEVKHRLCELRARGYESKFEAYWGTVRITINWQLYNLEDRSYCSPQFTRLGDSYEQIQAGAAFLKRLGRKIMSMRDYSAPVYNGTFKDPSEVIAALDDKGAVETICVELDRTFHDVAI